VAISLFERKKEFPKNHIILYKDKGKEKTKYIKTKGGA
jgi:hypothetical protein